MTIVNGAKPPVVHTSRIDPQNVDKLVGEGPLARANELLRLLELTNIPLYLVGDSGTGKTATMRALLVAYAKKHGVPAYYVQLSAEDTKTSMLMGLRLVNGTLMAVDGLLAQAAQEDAIVGVDEITHSTLQMLLMFNAIDGNSSVISIGDKSISASKLKIIYGSNLSNHAGNIKVPQSFANRVLAYPFDYPSPDDEAKIIESLTRKKLLEFAGTKTQIPIPASIYKYIARYISENRTHEYPLSSRNGAHACAYMHIARVHAISKDPSLVGKIDSYFTSGQNIEAIRQRIVERILGRKAVSTTDLQKPEITSFISFISELGVNKFREIVQMSMGVYIDIAGLELANEATRQKLITSII